MLFPKKLIKVTTMFGLMMMTQLPGRRFCRNHNGIVFGWHVTSSSTKVSRNRIQSSSLSTSLLSSISKMSSSSTSSTSTTTTPYKTAKQSSDNYYHRRMYRSNMITFMIRGGGGGDDNDKHDHWRNQQQTQISAHSTSSSSTRLLSVTSSSSSSSSSESSTTKISSTNDDDKEYKELLQLATESLCYPKVEYPIQQFGGLSYVNTASNDEKYRIVFVLGGPGAGKGTQCELMLQHYPTIHYSVGELLRSEQNNDRSPYQQLIQQTLSSGQIVPVHISLQLLYNAMKDAQVDISSTIVLVDGFPRNYDNLRGWCHNMKHVTILKSVLVYQCPLHVLEERIMQRSIASPGRSDDNRIAIQKRFVTFQQQTTPLVKVLRDVVTMTILGDEWIAPFSVIDITADQSIDDVWKETQQVLNQYIIDDVLTANAALLHAIENGNVTKYQQLSDPSWFDHTTSTTTTKDPTEIFDQNEGSKYRHAATADDNKIEVTNATVDAISGKHVIVGYHRMIDRQLLHEKRVWSHHPQNGWQQIHFIRKPI